MPPTASGKNEGERERESRRERNSKREKERQTDRALQREKDGRTGQRERDRKKQRERDREQKRWTERLGFAAGSEGWRENNGVRENGGAGGGAKHFRGPWRESGALAANQFSLRVQI